MSFRMSQAEENEIHQIDLNLEQPNLSQPKPVIRIASIQL